MKEEAIQLNNQGVQRFLNQDWENAQRFYEKAYQADPQNPAVLNNLGLLCHQKREYNQAIEYFQKASSLEEKPNYLVNEGNALAMSGEYAEAQKRYEQALTLQEDSEQALLSLAKLKAYTRDNEQAERYFKQLLQKHENPRHQYELALFYMQTQNYQEALFLLYALVQKAPQAEIWFQIGRGEFLTKNYGLAEKSFKTALAEQPDHRDFRYYLAITCLAMGEANEALYHLDMLLKLYPDDYETLTEKGVVLCGLQDFQSAKELFNRALKIKLDYPKAIRYRDMLVKQRPTLRKKKG